MCESALTVLRVYVSATVSMQRRVDKVDSLPNYFIDKAWFYLNGHMHTKNKYTGRQIIGTQTLLRKDLGSQLTENDVTDGRKQHPRVLSFYVEIYHQPHSGLHQAYSQGAVT
jgi:hypothetical protein